MITSYIRSRQRVWPAAGLLVGLILIGFDAWIAWTTFIPNYQVRNDFRLVYAAALVGLRSGYNHLYDLTDQEAAIRSLGSGFNPQPYITPPPLAWLVTPLTLLPFDIALAIWTALLLASLVVAWRLLAPGSGLARAAQLVLLLGLFPVAFGIMVGQPGAFVAVAVAASWWFIRNNHPVWAGLALSFLVLKPQLAVLVPFCLLLSGHAKTFGAWFAASAFVALMALAMLGPEGLSRYRDVLAMTQSPAWDITRKYAISGLFGLGPLLTVVQVAGLALTLLIAWRNRATGPEVPMAAGIVGSLLVTPYLGFQDFLMLVPAGWLILRSGPTPWQIGLLVVGYVLLEFCIPIGPVPILVMEGLLLESMWRPSSRPSR